MRKADLDVVLLAQLVQGLGSGQQVQPWVEVLGSRDRASLVLESETTAYPAAHLPSDIKLPPLVN